MSGSPATNAAPHRRRAGSPRIVERAAVIGYRAVEWLLAHLPPRIAREIGVVFTSAGYILWPSKRRWIDANFAHVLGVPPSDRRVRRTALAAYRNYARYLIEIMRLPSMPQEQRASQVDGSAVRAFGALLANSKGIIIAAAHVGNNEAILAGITHKGWPVNIVADDSTFPELFEHLRRRREEWGGKVIAWRNLREVYGALKRGEALALLVDWGYKPDGIPVRLFDAPTLLPAGPAYLAAKTGASIMPLAVRRAADGTFLADFETPFTVPSAEPADLAAATQKVADALERTIAAAPDQWYSFKPIWPLDPAEIERVRVLAEEAGIRPSGGAGAGTGGTGGTRTAEPA